MRVEFLSLGLVACLLIACESAPLSLPAKKASAATAKSAPRRVVIPQGGAYAGAYIDFGEHEDNVTLEGIERFDALVGKQQAIVAFANDWGSGSFPGRQLRIISNYGALPLVYWLPWDRPAEGWDSKPGRFALDAILSGQWDTYIDLWAARAKEFGQAFFVAWGLEMNGRWFPWSGTYYGGGKQVVNCVNCFQGPETFKRAYRYVVDRVRARGASNIVWVWHANNTSDPDEPWNAMAQYYPGPQYADWIGMSAYGTQFPTATEWFTFDEAVAVRYETLSHVDETKPIMLCEWGVGEFPEKGSKAEWITEFFARVPEEFPRIRAAVFWHERWANRDGGISNLRVNSSLEALAAYRKGIASPLWLARPIYEG